MADTARLGSFLRRALGRVSRTLDREATAMDAAVPDDADAPALAAEARLVHWVGPAFAVLAVALVPWTAYLALTLPARSVSGHYAVAWAGYDVLLSAGLLATGWAALRRSPSLVLAAGATGTLLAVDAWFDVLTSAERLDVVQASLLAVVVELPLAGLCFWLAWHTERLVDRSLVLALFPKPVAPKPVAPEAVPPGPPAAPPS
jgi:hypothetical protein